MNEFNPEVLIVGAFIVAGIFFWTRARRKRKSTSPRPGDGGGGGGSPRDPRPPTHPK